MPSFGPSTIHQGGRGVMALKTVGADTQWKVAGVTIDWATVTAVGSDTTLPDGRIIKAGDKYLRYGQVLCRITTGGKFGPYASGASDGRQTLTNGDCFVLNETVVYSEAGSDHPAVFDGGNVYPERLTDVAGAPALSALRTAFPRLAGLATATD